MRLSGKSAGSELGGPKLGNGEWTGSQKGKRHYDDYSLALSLSRSLFLSRSSYFVKGNAVGPLVQVSYSRHHRAGWAGGGEGRANATESLITTRFNKPAYNIFLLRPPTHPPPPHTQYIRKEIRKSHNVLEKHCCYRSCADTVASSICSFVFCVLHVRFDVASYIVVSANDCIYQELLYVPSFLHS